MTMVMSVAIFVLMPPLPVLVLLLLVALAKIAMVPVRFIFPANVIIVFRVIPPVVIVIFRIVHAVFAAHRASRNQQRPKERRRHKHRTKAPPEFAHLLILSGPDISSISPCAAPSKSPSFPKACLQRLRRSISLAFPARWYRKLQQGIPYIDVG